MKNLFDPAVQEEIIQRLEVLRPDADRLWGSMDAAQMLAHCKVTMDVAAGLRFPKRLFLGRILGPFFKPAFHGEKPTPKNSPTDASFVIADQRVFEEEKKRLIGIVRQFATAGEAGCTTHPHSFFGRLTPQEWSRGMYKHLDHHLRQFGS